MSASLIPITTLRHSAPPMPGALTVASDGERGAVLLMMVRALDRAPYRVAARISFEARAERTASYRDAEPSEGELVWRDALLALDRAAGARCAALVADTEDGSLRRERSRRRHTFAVVTLAESV